MSLRWFFLFLPFLVYSGIPVVIENPQALSYAEDKLPSKGVLKQAKDGFLYVELPKEYVFDILPLLESLQIKPPPYFSEGLVGAHITVASANEISALNFPKIANLGQTISFKIVNLARIEVDNRWLGSEICYFTVSSPQLEQIRSQLDLPPMRYDFHITVGVK